jgi:putative YhbY family RNA-binding protein
MTEPLSPAERQALKARAHALRPVVMVGAEGLTDAVARELDAALRAHELVKVRVLAGDREEREAMLAALCAAAGAAAVQHIGKILVLYRARAIAEEAPSDPMPAPRGSRKSRAQGKPAASRPQRAAPAPRPGDSEAPKRWTFIREEGRPGRAPKRTSKGRKPVRRIGAPKRRSR